MTSRLLFLLLGGAGLLAGCGGGATTDPDGFARKTGSLGSGDESLTSGEYTDSYTFDAQAGQWIEVAMTSAEFDPYIILRPPSCANASGACQQQVDNDDFGQGTDAFVWHRADEAGRWTVLATSSTPGENGAYELAYRAVAAGEQPATPGVALGSGRTERGRLESGDGTLNSGEFVDRYGFVARAGEALTVDLRSTAFDPYVILQMPDEQQLDNDDWEGASDHARIEHTLPADGMYTVLVTSYAVGETGDYELQITPGGGSTPAPAGEAASTGATDGQGGDPFAK
ncbi:MAG TPA: hypothetical protein VK002_00625 [Rubricoccaceae bacterium]|nr:hypothetical protein [Rubricoccaceae bacterium]